jgi:UDP-N-acetylglucosamine acyltransferase
MTAKIHPLACVDIQAELADDVEVGPFCVIGPHVKISAGCVLQNHVTIVGHTTIGFNNRFFPYSAIGCEPQDLGYTGAPTRVEIGDNNIFREGVTVHRGAEKEDWVTRIGNRNMFFSNAHIAHNCRIYNDAMLVNGVLLGGHVHVHDGAIVSGNTVVHHFASLGTLAFITGGSRLVVDLPPYMLAAGNDKLEVPTVNLVGMKRKGIPTHVIQIIRRAHRLLFREFKAVEYVKQLFDAEFNGDLPKELNTLLEFIFAQHRGVNGRGREAIRRAKAA